MKGCIFEWQFVWSGAVATKNVYVNPTSFSNRKCFVRNVQAAPVINTEVWLEYYYTF